jgi:hypothetical protein
MTGSGGDSWYNALQVLLTRRLSKGLELQGSYTWSRSIDDGQGQAGGETVATPVYPADPTNIMFYERGPSTFDINQNLHVNAIYQFPDFHQKEGVLGSTLSGWGLRGILTDESGYPFTPVDSTNQSRSLSAGGSNTVDRPNLNAGRTPYNATHGVSSGCTTSTGTVIAAGTPLGMPTLYLDPCAFNLQTIGTLGDVGRDSFRGPGLVNLDFSIIKDTPLKFREGAALEFRAEMFNILNHPNFVTPEIPGNGGANTAAGIFGSSPLPVATAGILSTTANPAREIQFALKLLF